MTSSDLRARIAAALGLAVLFPVMDGHAVAETGGSGADAGGSGAGLDTFCAAGTLTTSGADPACGDGEAHVGQATATWCTVTEVFGDGVYDPDTGECCWKVSIDCDPKPYNCGCYGRPLVVDGAVRTAASTPRRGWQADGVSPGPVSVELRAALVRFWLDNAEAEHSSVAGFAKFTLDLLAVGAPATLVERAQVAGIEELAHARACYALASAYAGFSLGPRPLASPSIALATDLVELAVHTAREGCVGETVAAQLAAEVARRATDPAVRRVMTAIAEEEARHAELAWETLAWAIRRGGDAVREAVAGVLAEGVRPAAATGAPDRPELRAHGLLPDAEQAEICARAYAEVVRPLAESLLARAAA